MPRHRLSNPVRLVVVLGLASLVLAGCETAEGPPLDAWGERVATDATAFTVRLPAGDPERQAIVLTQTVYPATREENAVGAIILAPQDEATAFLAMHRVTHMPVNAPLLYLTPDGRLGAATRAEMERLRPDGVVQDGKTQVYAVGDVRDSVVETVRDELGYRVRRLRAESPFALAELADRWQAALKSDHPDEVVIAALSREGMEHGIGAMGWNAHMGRGFAWVTRDRVPEETRRILERRLGLAYIYIQGGEDIVSADVERELARYGVVRRIAGLEPAATNAVHAGYKDFGRNVGWWWSEASRMYGWGIAQAGHNFIVGSPDDLLGLIAASVLGHMGKHGPILLVERDRVPRATADYLRMVQPSLAVPRRTILNFAWVIGDESRIGPPVQAELDRLLAPSLGREGGEGREGPRAAAPEAEPTAPATPATADGGAP